MDKLTRPIYAMLKLFPLYQIKRKRAIQWWFQKQKNEAFNLSEIIREDLLQETFSVRRQLELVLVKQSSYSQTRFIKKNLQKLEQIYKKLDLVADQLAPFYLDYQWPLAIEQAMKPLGREGKGLQIYLDLPENWDYKPPQQNYLFLKFLTELLTISVSKTSGKPLIMLKLENKQIIQVKIKYCNYFARKVVSDSVEISYLRLAYQFLTNGKINQKVFNSQVIYSLSW